MEGYIARDSPLYQRGARKGIREKPRQRRKAPAPCPVSGDCASLPPRGTYRTVSIITLRWSNSNKLQVICHSLLVWESNTSNSLQTVLGLVTEEVGGRVLHDLEGLDFAYGKVRLEFSSWVGSQESSRAYLCFECEGHGKDQPDHRYGRRYYTRPPPVFRYSAT